MLYSEMSIVLNDLSLQCSVTLTTFNKFHMSIPMVQQLNVVIRRSVRMLLLLLMHGDKHTQKHARISAAGNLHCNAPPCTAAFMFEEQNLQHNRSLRGQSFIKTPESPIRGDQRLHATQLTHIKHRKRQEKNEENRDRWTPRSRMFHLWDHLYGLKHTP